MRTTWIAMTTILLCLPITITGQKVPQNGLDLSALIGTWKGIGTFDGNKLLLTREWRHELGGEVLRTDMGVDMPNGISFQSLAYWHRKEANQYDVVMMDEGGRFQFLEGIVAADGQELTVDFLDEHADDGPAMRRWAYNIVGQDTYTELLLGQEDGAWIQLAEFRFHRNGVHQQR